MPNTKPVIDNAVGVEYVKARAAAVGKCRVHVAGSCSQGLKGDTLSEMGDMVAPRWLTAVAALIAVTIIGILGAFVYPLYNDYVKRAYRAQIVVLLSEQSQSLERFYTKKGLYSGAENVSPGNQHYLMTYELADHTYLLTATRRADSPMAGDACGDYTLNHVGLAANTNAAPDLTRQQCWGR